MTVYLEIINDQISLLPWSDKALSIFDLNPMHGDVTNKDLMTVVAKAAGAPIDSFIAQFEDVRPRALNAATRLIKVHDKSRTENKNAWKEVIDRIKSRRDVALGHPTDALEKGLQLYYGFGLSSSGVEQSFSKSQLKFGNRRQAAKAETEEYALKVILDLPHHNIDEITQLAQQVWVLTFPATREVHQSRIDQGVKKRKPLSDITNGNRMADTEHDFIKRRRLDISRSARCDNGVDITTESLVCEGGGAGWTEKHEEELQFQKNKTHARKLQSIAEGVTEGDAHGKNEVAKVFNQRLKDHLARRRKARRDTTKMNGISGKKLLEIIQNKTVHISTNLQQAKQDELRHAFRRLALREVESHEADVFVVTAPGKVNKSIMTTSIMRGSHHVTPDMFNLLSCDKLGCSLKWNAFAEQDKVIYVSGDCHRYQKVAWDHLDNVLKMMPSGTAKLMKVVYGKEDKSDLKTIANTYKNPKWKFQIIVCKSELREKVISFVAHKLV